jgi:esterase/lipase superfamily enzyme
LRTILVLGATCLLAACSGQEQKAKVGHRSSQQARDSGETMSGPTEQPASPAESKALLEKPAQPSERPAAAEPAAPPEGVLPQPSARPQEPAAASPPQAAAPTEEQDDYTVVKVYYGTDRARLDTAEPQAPAYVAWLTGLLASAGASLILVAVAFRYYPARLTRNLAFLAVGTAVVLVFMTAYTALRDKMPWSHTGEAEAIYGNERGELELGTCRVAIPKDHRVGNLESPSIFRLQLREDPGQHVTLLSVAPLPADQFYADLQSCVERSQEKAALVFVHGFAVHFQDAVRRTAQIAYDLRYQGAPICYSWPSQGGFLQYAVDETNVEWTVPHLKQFLTEIADRSRARQIHLIAHSMGNRALTSALRYLAYEGDKRARFHQVVLTAPDIDAEVFKRDIAPAIVKTAHHVTLYASSSDEALKLSKEVHGYPRAGDTDDELVVVPGVDTIDVSAVDTSLLGHSYYGNNDSVLADLFELLHDSKPPAQRRWLLEQRLGALTYWIFQRE